MQHIVITFNYKSRKPPCDLFNNQHFNYFLLQNTTRLLYILLLFYHISLPWLTQLWVKFTLSQVERQRCWTKTALGIDAVSLLIFVRVFYRWCKFTVCAAESESIKKKKLTVCEFSQVTGSN